MISKDTLIPKKFFLKVWSMICKLILLSFFFLVMRRNMGIICIISFSLCFSVFHMQKTWCTALWNTNTGKSQMIFMTKHFQDQYVLPLISMRSNNPKVRHWIFKIKDFNRSLLELMFTHVLGNMQTSTICIPLRNCTKMHLHILTHSRIHAHTNKTVTHLHKWKQGTVMKPDTESGNSLSLSLSACLQCPVFLSLTPLHLFYIMFSAISLSNAALSFLCLSLSFCSNWGKWVLASRKKDNCGSEQHYESTEEREQMCSNTPHRWIEKTQPMIEKACVWGYQTLCVSQSLCLCVYNGYQERLTAFHFCQQNTGDLKPYQFPLIVIGPSANHVSDTQTHIWNMPIQAYKSPIQWGRRWIKGQVAIK